MRFCKDCSHYKWHWKLCAHPDLVDRVTGAPVDAAPLRSDFGVCGKDAMYFSSTNVEFNIEATDKTEAGDK